MKKSTAVYFTIIALALGSISAGCARMQEIAGKNIKSSQRVAPKPRYLDFPDILIPGEMNKDNGETFIMDRYGRLVITGRVSSQSLKKFFIASMPSDGWRLLNEYSYGDSIKLFFSKPGGICTILITENPLGTKAEIWRTLQKTE